MNATAESRPLTRWEGALRAGAPHFQRGEAWGRVPKLRRRFAFRPKDVALAVLGLSLLLAALSRAYLFTIGWKGFAVRTVVLECPVESARPELEAALSASRPGNIFLLDIGGLKGALERHPWVGEAVIRRDFPATLRIEIRPRRPAAVVAGAGGFRLVSRDGVILESAAKPPRTDLPLFRDAGGFRTDAAAKTAQAWACLDALGPDAAGRVESLDLSDPGNIVLVLRGGPTRLLMGADRFAEKLDLFLEAEAWLRERFGALDYVDLRLFQDRVTVRPAAAPPQAPPAPLSPIPAKEAD